MSEEKQDELDLQPTEEETPPETEESEEDSGSFEAAFHKARGEEVPEPEKVEDPEPEETPEEPEEKEEEQSEPEPEPEPEAASAEEPEEPAEKTELEKAYERIQKLEGRYGSLLQRVNTLAQPPQRSAAQQQTAPNPFRAPSQKQVRAALKNEGKLKELVQEFPSFEPMLEELRAIRQESSNVDIPQVDQEKLIETATENVRFQIENDDLARAHPTWQDDVKTEEFRTWSIEGGPNETEFAQFQATAQYDANAAQHILNGFAAQYPDWWEEKGQGLFSSRPSDTRKVMDSFKESLVPQEETAPPPVAKPRSKKRLERAVAPQGAAETPSTGISDSEAFERGFQNARGH